MADTDTLLALTGVYSGLKLEMAGSGGTLAFSAAFSGQSGYAMDRRKDNDGVAYTVLTLSGQKNVVDPPAVIVTANYVQRVAYEEVDLDVRYTDIPAGTWVEVDCSQSGLSIPKKKISGTNLIGSTGLQLGAFDSTIALRLWIPAATSLKPTSALSVSLNSIQGNNAGPVKKVLLQKFALNLSH